MGLIEDILNDANDFLTDSQAGPATPITLTDQYGQVAMVNGLSTKHHLNLDTEGNQVSGKNASISVSEAEIIASNPLFKVRNAQQEAAMKGVRVSVPDSTGVAKQYIVNVCFADEKMGIFTCILGDYK